MSEYTSKNPSVSKPSGKFGCLFYVIVIVIILGVVVWFNIFRPGPPLRISKETTYITEPLTVDGRYVDYFAAMQQAIHPPEMQTDENGYRVVFRALGDFEGETTDFLILQKHYEALGLDATRDKPTMNYTPPEDYFNKRYDSHPEEFEELIAVEKKKDIRRQEESLREQIEEIQADQDWSEEEKTKTIASFEERIAFVRMSDEEKKEKFQADMEKIRNDSDMPEHDKEQEMAWIQYQIDELGSPDSDGFDTSFTLHAAWNSLIRSNGLHENAVMRRWLEENDAALDLVTEQVKKPIFVTPYFKTTERQLLIAVLLPDAQAVRSLARGLQARSQIRLGEGDIDGAIDDTIACYQLGRHIEKKATLVEGLVGLACEGIASSLPYDINPETRANAEQLKRLQGEIARLSPQTSFSLHKMEYERYGCLDSMLSLMRGTWFSDFGDDEDVVIRQGMSIIGLDWNIVFKKVNLTYDGLIAGTYTYTTPSMSPTRFLTLKSRSEMVADIFIGLLLPAADAAKEAYRRLECTMNMRRIVLAMHLYEREHGTLPPTFTVDETGKPLHSWRTLLLPYLNDTTLAELHSQIRLDEPWDSEHNRPFHELNIDVYRCPSADKEDGETNYTVIVGDDLLFTADGKGQPFAECGPFMLLLGERNDGVCWMRPDAEISQAEAEKGVNREFIEFAEMAIDGDFTRATDPISSNHTGGCNFGLRDGGVTFISEIIGSDVFRKLVRGEAEERP